jgi:hypothetical protein
MTLCWSLDKLGPMTRGVEDTLLVLQAISGPDPGDTASVPSRLDFDATRAVKGLRLGYFPAWMKEWPSTEVDLSALETARKIGFELVEVSLPDWPYDSLNLILFAEGAAAFEELTLSGGLRELKAQVPDAWPNLFRQARFLSAVDFVQADPCGGRSQRNGPPVFASGPPAGAFPAGRNAGRHKLHRPSLADFTGRLRRGTEGPKRLSAGPGASFAHVCDTEARAARHNADRAPVR